jgi:hypothetical protein
LRCRSWFVRTCVQPRKLILPTQVAEPHRQQQRQHNQKKLPGTSAASMFFLVIEQVIEISRTRMMRIDTQVGALARRWRIVQSKK